MGVALSSQDEGCCVGRGHGSQPSSGCQAGGGGRQAGERLQLREALTAFRARGSELLERCGEGGDGALRLPSWDGACGLLEALLFGAQRHLPEVTAAAEVWASPGGPLPPASGSASGPGGRAGRILSLTVEFGSAPLIGEFATRSHLGCEIRLAKVVRFSLLSPASRSDDESLVVEAEGFDFDLLPDILEMRQRLQRRLGALYNAENVYSWWVNHVAEEFPLQTSKAHRILESIFGVRSFQLTVPAKVKVAAVWALVNAVPTPIASLEFAEERSHGLRVAARTRAVAPPLAPTSEEDAERCAAIMRETLVRDEKVGDVFAPSAFNFMRFLQGHAVGQPGGSAAKLTKLFSATHTSGPGRDGWQRHDHTWLAVDEKNLVGRTVRENGRVIWRRP